MMFSTTTRCLKFDSRLLNRGNYRCSSLIHQQIAEPANCVRLASGGPDLRKYKTCELQQLYNSPCQSSVATETKKKGKSNHGCFKQHKSKHLEKGTEIPYRKLKSKLKKYRYYGDSSSSSTSSSSSSSVIRIRKKSKHGKYKVTHLKSPKLVNRGKVVHDQNKLKCYNCSNLNDNKCVHGNACFCLNLDDVRKICCNCGQENSTHKSNQNDYTNGNTNPKECHCSRPVANHYENPQNSKKCCCGILDDKNNNPNIPEKHTKCPCKQCRCPCIHKPDACPCKESNNTTKDSPQLDSYKKESEHNTQSYNNKPDCLIRCYCKNCCFCQDKLDLDRVEEKTVKHSKQCCQCYKCCKEIPSEYCDYFCTCDKKIRMIPVKQNKKRASSSSSSNSSSTNVGSNQKVKSQTNVKPVKKCKKFMCYLKSSDSEESNEKRHKKKHMIVSDKVIWQLVDNKGVPLPIGVSFINTKKGSKNIEAWLKIEKNQNKRMKYLDLNKSQLFCKCANTIGCQCSNTNVLKSTRLLAGGENVFVCPISGRVVSLKSDFSAAHQVLQTLFKSENIFKFNENSFFNKPALSLTNTTENKKNNPISSCNHSGFENSTSSTHSIESDKVNIDKTVEKVLESRTNSASKIDPDLLIKNVNNSTKASTDIRNALNFRNLISLERSLKENSSNRPSNDNGFLRSSQIDTNIDRKLSKLVTKRKLENGQYSDIKRCRGENEPAEIFFNRSNSLILKIRNLMNKLKQTDNQQTTYGLDVSE